LNLGPSGIRTRRGPFPATGIFLNDDAGSVLFASMTDLGTSRVFFPIRGPSLGGDCRTVDPDIGMIAAGTAGTLDVRLELFVAVVEVDIRGMSLLLLTILSAGTGGGGGCNFILEEFGVDKTFCCSPTSGGGFDCATRVHDDRPWLDSRASSFIRLNIGIQGT